MLRYFNNTFAEAFGAQILRFLRGTGALSRFAFRSWWSCVSPPWDYRLIMDQAMAIGVRSLPIAIMTALFVGLVGVLQTGVQLNKFGAKSYVPAIAFIANAREMIPVFIAFVVGSRVAASITAEMGSMRVTEQIDAMEILNVDPFRYLIAPRMLAATLLLPLIAIFCLFAAFGGGTIVAWSGLLIHPQEYYEVSKKFAYLSDVYFGLGKTVVFGNIIALVGCYFGYNTHGGAEGVGRATTTSVVVTLMLILLLNFIMTRWFLVLSPNLS
ncbi:MAG: phospholipid/cholesterol/gamma-HCH transport system permease protein [Candidatus Sumerlaeota bacterium]|nr:phospholipid/cholesterol/gamma-HCH transport system permease protein [Candidatus Sumerlaeota bacterium]